MKRTLVALMLASGCAPKPSETTSAPTPAPGPAVGDVPYHAPPAPKPPALGPPDPDETDGPTGMPTTGTARPVQGDTRVEPGVGDTGRCYQQALDRNANVRGRLVVALRIAADGSVLDARVAAGTTTADEKLHGCILAVLRDVTFVQLAAGKEVRVSHPFVFGE